MRQFSEKIRNGYSVNKLQGPRLACHGTCCRGACSPEKLAKKVFTAMVLSNSENFTRSCWPKWYPNKSHGTFFNFPKSHLNGSCLLHRYSNQIKLPTIYDDICIYSIYILSIHHTKWLDYWAKPLYFGITRHRQDSPHPSPTSWHSLHLDAKGSNMLWMCTGHI